MFAQLILLFASVKLTLADGEHQYYGCHDTKDDCETVDSIEVTQANGFKHYCNCYSTSRNYQVTFKFDTSFSIPSQFFVNSRISSVKIPPLCTEIEAGAFYGSTIGTLTFETDATPSIRHDAFGDVTFTGGLSLPSKMTNIENSAFYWTNFQSTLTLPDDLQNVQSYAFQYANFNEDVTFKSKVEKIFRYAFYNSKFQKALTFSSKLVIDGNSFKKAEIHGLLSFKNAETQITSYYDSENSKYNGAFESAVFDETLVLPTELTTIPNNAFYEAIFKKSITLPNTLETISANAFEEAQFTGSITLPSSLETIGSSAFRSCVFNLENTLVFGKNVETISEYAFQKSNLQSIAFDPNAKLETISTQAFEGLFQLTIAGDSKTLYSKTISTSAFEGDENIDFYSITSKTINKNAFRNCFNLVAKDGILILADGSIQDYAFQNCQKLNGALTIEDSIYTDIKYISSSIGKCAFQDTSISKLNLPQIKTINDYAFKNCISLEGPSSEDYNELKVETISQYAFSGDVKLHYTKIVSKTINGHAFEFCHNLGADILIYENQGQVSDYAFYACDNLGNLTFDLSHLNDYEMIDESQAIDIPTYAFAKSGLSGKLVIPYIIKEIKDYAFSNCPNITEIEINRQQTVFLKIGEFAFCNSNIGSNLVIPRFVSSIEKYAFANTLIRSLTVEGTSFLVPVQTRANEPYKEIITEIKNRAFFDCKNLETVIFGNETVQIQDDTFRGCNIKSMTLGNINKIPDDAFIGMTDIDGNFDIPDSVTEIGSRAFSECSNIQKITITPKSSLTKIGEAAFYRCTGITSIVIPSGVHTISSHAFYQCTNLETITILSHVKGKSDDIQIQDYAFYGCTKLTGTLTLPEGLSSIGEGAFQGCRELGGSLIFPNSLTSIKERAFMGCRSLTGGLNFGVNVQTIGKYAFRDCEKLNGKLNFIDYYGEDEKELCLNEGAFYGCYQLNGDLNLPLRCQLKKKTQIGADQNGKPIYSYDDSINVFKGCSGLDGQLYLPDDLIVIPAGTFCDCSLLNGEVKENLEKIGNEAFRNCAKLTGSIDLTHYNYTNYIGSYAFYNCTGLNGQLIFSDLSDIEYIKIGEYAFYNCVGLTGPLNCTSFNYVQRYAFAGCKGFNGPLNFGRYLLKIGDHAFADCTGFSDTLSFRPILENELSIEESAFKGCTGFKDGTLLIVMARSDSITPATNYHLKIERNAFEDTKFKDIRYIGRTQPDCDCDIGLPSRKGIHTSSNYDGKSFCGNPLHKSKLSGGAIAGIVIACIVVVAAIIFLIVYFILKNKKNKDNSENEVEMNQDP